MTPETLSKVLIQPVTTRFYHSKRHGSVRQDELDLDNVYGDLSRYSLMRYGIAIATLTTPTSIYGVPILDEKTGRGPFMQKLEQTGLAQAEAPQKSNGKVLETGKILFSNGNETRSVQQIIETLGDLSWNDKGKVRSLLRSSQIYQHWQYAQLTQEEIAQRKEDLLFQEVGYEWSQQEGEAALGLFPLIVILGLFHQSGKYSRRTRELLLRELSEKIVDYYDKTKDEYRGIEERLASLVEPLNASERLRTLAFTSILQGRQEVLVQRPFVTEDDYNANDSEDAHTRFEKTLQERVKALADMLIPAK